MTTLYDLNSINFINYFSQIHYSSDTKTYFDSRVNSDGTHGDYITSNFSSHNIDDQVKRIEMIFLFLQTKYTEIEFSKISIIKNFLEEYPTSIIFAMKGGRDFRLYFSNHQIIQDILRLLGYSVSFEVDLLGISLSDLQRIKVYRRKSIDSNQFISSSIRKFIKPSFYYLMQEIDTYNYCLRQKIYLRVPGVPLGIITQKSTEVALSEFYVNYIAFEIGKIHELSYYVVDKNNLHVSNNNGINHNLNI